MKKAEKVLFVDNLTAELKSAKSVVLINFTGLSVKAQQELKRRLINVDARMLVVKNTLLKRAGEAAKIDKQLLTDDILTGQTALVVSSGDPLAFIQVLGKFAAEFAVPKMKVGVIDAQFQNSETLAKLAALPGRDVLLGQLLAMLMVPPAGLVNTLQNPTQQLLYTLNQKSKS